MAKAVTETGQEKSQKRRNIKFFKVLFAIFIPLLFIILLCLLFLRLAGVSPEKFVSSVMPFHQTNSVKPLSGTSVEISALKKQISKKDNQISKLQNQNDQKDDQISQLTSSLRQAQKAANQNSSSNAGGKVSKATMQVYAQTYKNMDAAKAAAIFSQLPTNQAAAYLNMLDNQTKAAILENMPADKAAQLTQQLQASADAGSSSSQ
ncbi:MAG: hypothetical protein ABF868_03625 [Sporolactobacillus sp.]